MKQGLITAFKSGGFEQEAIVQETQLETSTPGSITRAMILKRPADTIAALITKLLNPDGSSLYKIWLLGSAVADLAAADLSNTWNGGEPYNPPFDGLQKFQRVGADGAVFELRPDGRFFEGPNGGTTIYFAEVNDNPTLSRRSNIAGHIDRILDAGADAVFVDFRESTNPLGIVYAAKLSALADVLFGMTLDLNGEEPACEILTDAVTVPSVGGSIGVFI